MLGNIVPTISDIGATIRCMPRSLRPSWRTPNYPIQRDSAAEHG